MVGLEWEGPGVLLMASDRLTAAELEAIKTAPDVTALDAAMARVRAALGALARVPAPAAPAAPSKAVP